MTRSSAPFRIAAALLVVAAAAACQSGDQAVPDDSLTRDLQLVQAEPLYDLNDLAGAPPAEPSPQAAPPARPPAPKVTPPPVPTPEPEPEPEPEPLLAPVPIPELPDPVLAETPADAPAPLPTAKAGTSFNVQVATNISSRINRPGDAVTGRVASDVTDENGQVIIPAGSLILGRISDLRQPDSQGRGGRIELTFNSIVVNGESHPIDAVTQNLPVEVRDAGRTGPSTATRAGTGAVIGGILGSIFGGRKGTIIGAGAGAAAGALSNGGEKLFEVALASSNVACVLNGPFSQASILRSF